MAKMKFLISQDKKLTLYKNVNFFVKVNHFSLASFHSLDFVDDISYISDFHFWSISIIRLLLLTLLIFR